MLEVLIAIIPLFLVIFASALFQRVKNIKENWESVLNSFALNIGLPALIFSALAKTTISLSKQTDLAGFYFGIKLFGFSTKEFGVSIVEAAMPLAITPFALADEFKLHKKFIARSIVLSTILSIVSIPFWTSIL